MPGAGVSIDDKEGGIHRIAITNGIGVTRQEIDIHRGNLQIMQGLDLRRDGSSQFVVIQQQVVQVV